MLVAADHLLPHISSNPLITRPLDGSDRAARTRWRSTWSPCARPAQMDLDIVLPGHGEPFTDHAQLIDKRFALHQRRAEKLHGLIARAARAPPTSWPRRCGATSP